MSTTGEGSQELKELSERLKFIDLAIGERKEKTRPRLLLASAVLVGLVVTLLATVRMPTTEVDATVQASAAELLFSGVDELSGISLLEPIAVKGLSAVAVGGVPYSSSNLAFDGIRITSSTTAIQRMPIGKGSTLRMEADAKSLDLVLTGSSPEAGLTLVTSGPSTLSLFSTVNPAGTMDRPLAGVEVIQLTHRSARGIPLRISSSGLTEAVRVAPKAVEQVTFTMPSPPHLTVARRESSLELAQIKVGPKGRETLLDRSDRLELTGLKDAQVRIQLCAPAPAAPEEKRCKWPVLRIVGTVDDVAVGRAYTTAALQSLKPTLLEFMKESHLVALLWGAAVFVFGVGWSIWKAIFE